MHHSGIAGGEVMVCNINLLMSLSTGKSSLKVSICSSLAGQVEQPTLEGVPCVMNDSNTKENSMLKKE